MLKNFLSYLSTNLLIRRSPKWGKVRKQFLKDNGNICACCSRTDNLNVHHIIPVHIDPSLELDKNNLIILCENKNLNCHLVYGHLLDYRAYNEHVIEDVKFWNNRLLNKRYK